VQDWKSYLSKKILNVIFFKLWQNSLSYSTIEEARKKENELISDLSKDGALLNKLIWDNSGYAATSQKKDNRRSIKMDTLSVICKYCSRKFLSEEILGLHFKKYHHGKFICSICMIAYSTKTILERHMKNHCS